MALPGRPDFWGKLRKTQQARRTRVGLALPVRMDRMPAPMQLVDDPIFPFGRSIVEAVGEQVCAYAIPLMAFLAEGAAGMVAMERLMRYLPDSLPILLDVRWRDPGTAERCARAAFEVWGADAVTVAPEFPAEAAVALARPPGGAVFWWVGRAEDWGPAQRHARAARAQGIPAGLAPSARAGIPVEGVSDLPWIALDVGDLSELPEAAAGPPPAVVFIGEPILYASLRSDFQEAARRAAEGWRQALAARFPISTAEVPSPDEGPGARRARPPA